MNKFAKIVLLYIVFGIIIAIAVSFGGLYQSLVIENTLGGMTTVGYIAFMGLIVVGWVPALITSVKFEVIPYANIISIAISAVFIALSAVIVKRK